MRLYLYCFILASAALILPASASAQSILIKNKAGNTVNNDTITVYPEFVQKPPYTLIHAYFHVQNVGTGTITTRAKKTELSLTPGAEHAICYAGMCYTTNIFVSPLTVTLTPSQSDSTFSGSYRYLASSITPNDLVAYTVFDENNTADSAIVYVRYLPAPTSVQTQTVKPAFAVKAYPNPATAIINFSCDTYSSGTLYFTNALGQVIYKLELSNNHRATINTTQWQSGIYYYSFYTDSGASAQGSFTVQH